MAYSKKKKPLVRFDYSHYKYPNTVHVLCYLSETYLDSYWRDARSKWLIEIEQLRNSRFYDVIRDLFYEENDPAELRGIIKSHGVFSEKFFVRNIRPRLVRVYTRHHIEQHSIEGLLSEAWGRKCKVYDAKSVILDYIFYFCILELEKHQEDSQFIEEWLHRYGVAQQCGLCGKAFRLIDLPDWVYFGGNGYKQCCFSCHIVEQPVKKELLTLLPQFVEECGFIPNSSISPREYSFTSRISPDRWKSVILAYAKMGGVEHIKKKYGSWFKGLAETGALPEGVLTTARGIRCLSKDKHVCHSLDEQRIDNWLFKRNIDHEREPAYPTHIDLNPSGRRLADWKVGDIYIEYFGLVGDPRYDKKMDEKLQLAEITGIEMISIFPDEIEHLEKKLGPLQKIMG